MFFKAGRARFSLLTLLILFSLRSAAENFRIATYNVENFLDHASGTRPAKSEAAKAKVCESIVAAKPDVLAMQEIGSTNVLMAIQTMLKTNGIDLPNWELITGYDTNIHVAILSRFPLVARHAHTNDSIVISGHRLIVSRGFAEVEIQVNSNLSFTLIDAHLKSKRPIAITDQADLRLEEAKILRQKIDDCFNANPKANLVVLGDLNDSHDSPAVKTILGKGKKGLVDTRPAERNGDDQPHSDRRLAPRNITWTHFYSKEDSYSRIDYILLSRNMSRNWISDESFVVTVPNWGLASDHRPVVAVFTDGGQ